MGLWMFAACTAVWFVVATGAAIVLGKLIRRADVLNERRRKLHLVEM